MQSDEVMKLARGRGRVKSLDSVAGGSCSRSSNVGLIDTLLEQTFSIGNNREKNYKEQQCSGRTRAKTCLVSEQRVYSSVLGMGRGGSGKGHTEKVAAAACGRILFVAQHPSNNICVYLSQALLSTDSVSGEVR